MAKIHDNSAIFLHSSGYRFEPCHHYSSKLCLSLRNVTAAFLGLGHLALGTYQSTSSRGVWGHFRRVWSLEGSGNTFIVLRMIDIQFQNN